LNKIKQKISLFLFSEYYFFWAAGLTAGIYAGYKYYFYKPCAVITGVTVIFLLMAVEFIVSGRILSNSYKSGLCKDIYGGGKPFGRLKVCISLQGEEPYPAYFKRKTVKMVVLIIIPFLILIAAGSLIAGAYQYRQSKSFFLPILNNEGFIMDSMTVEGRVMDHPCRRFNDLLFLLEVEKIYVSTDSGNLIKFFKIKEPLKIEMKNPGEGFPERDDYLRLGGNLKEKDLKNLKLNIYGAAVFTADSGNAIKIEYRNLVYKAYTFRNRLYGCIKKTFYGNLSIKDACIAEAVILGNRNNIPGHIMENFKRCGTYHLFAISGLHVSFFMSIIYLWFRKLNSSYAVFWAAIIFLIIYNFLVGERASMLRASIMAALMFLARNWNREYSCKILLCLSYIIMMLFNPSFLYDLGFWMSYGSMAALILVYPALMTVPYRFFPFLKRSRGWFFIKIALMTFSIQIALLPVMAYYFGEISLISPVANILIIPVFYVLIFILMASSLISLIWPPAGGFMLKTGNILFEYILKVAEILGRNDFFIINFDSFSIKNMVIYYIIFLITLYAVPVSIRRLRIGKKAGGQVSCF